MQGFPCHLWPQCLWKKEGSHCRNQTRGDIVLSGRSVQLTVEQMEQLCKLCHVRERGKEKVMVADRYVQGGVCLKVQLDVYSTFILAYLYAIVIRTVALARSHIDNNILSTSVPVTIPLKINCECEKHKGVQISTLLLHPRDSLPVNRWDRSLCLKKLLTRSE